MSRLYIIILIVLLCSTRTSSQVGGPDSIDASVNSQVITGWVTFKGDSLFTVNTSFGPYTPRERAELINRHINVLSENDLIVKDSFNITNKDAITIIDYRGMIIMGLTDQDADIAGLTRDELTDEIIDSIILSLEAHSGINNFTDWLYRIGMTLLLLAGLILLYYLVNRLFRWGDQKLTVYENKLKRKPKNFLRYLSPKGTKSSFSFLLRLIRITLYILILFLYLPLLFSFFPWSKHLVTRFYNFLTDPLLKVINGLYNFLDNLILIIIIILIARYIIRIMKYVSREIEQDKLQVKGFHKDWAKPTYNILKIIIYAFALVFMFPYLPGSGSPAFQGVSIFLGILLSLGSTSAISNIIAGIVITYMRPFVVGDRVQIGQTVGDVAEKSLLVTKIRTLKNEYVTIPNATIINTHLWNFSVSAQDIGLILHTSVTIGYDVPWQKVNELLLKAAKNTPNLTRDLKPFVLQKSLNDFYVEYELNVYTRRPGKMAEFYSELHKHILEAFNDAGVEIMSPHYNAIRDGNPSTTHDMPDTRNPVEKIIGKVTGKE